MRGLSKEKLSQVGEQNGKMEIRGMCTNAFEQSVYRDPFEMTSYTEWKTEYSQKPSLSSYLSGRQMSR